MKKISNLFWVLAVILSNVMSAVVAYNYSEMKCGIKYAGYSAPASAAFLYAFPYGIGIVVCIVLAVVLRKKENK